MNITFEKYLKKYFQVLKETFVLAYNVKEIQPRKNLLKKLTSQHAVSFLFFKNIKIK